MSGRYNPHTKHPSMSKITSPTFEPVLSPQKRSPQKTNSFKERPKRSPDGKNAKNISIERILKTESSIGRDNSHIHNESLLIGNLAQEPTASEISLFNTLGNELRDEGEFYSPVSYLLCF